MTDLRKAAEMALEVLETTWGNGSEGTLKQWEETIQALRQALAEEKNNESLGLATRDYIQVARTIAEDDHG